MSSAWHVSFQGELPSENYTRAPLVPSFEAALRERRHEARFKVDEFEPGLFHIVSPMGNEVDENSTEEYLPLVFRDRDEADRLCDKFNQEGYFDYWIYRNGRKFTGLSEFWEHSKRALKWFDRQSRVSGFTRKVKDDSAVGYHWEDAEGSGCMELRWERVKFNEM